MPDSAATPPAAPHAPVLELEPVLEMLRRFLVADHSDCTLGKAVVIVPEELSLCGALLFREAARCTAAGRPAADILGVIAYDEDRPRTIHVPLVLDGSDVRGYRTDPTWIARHQYCIRELLRARAWEPFAAFTRLTSAAADEDCSDRAISLTVVGRTAGFELWTNSVMRSTTRGGPEGSTVFGEPDDLLDGVLA